jgi:hypothetical protein
VLDQVARHERVACADGVDGADRHRGHRVGRPVDVRHRPGGTELDDCHRGPERRERGGQVGGRVAGHDEACLVVAREHHVGQPGQLPELVGRPVG